MKNLLRFLYFGELGPTFKIRRTKLDRGEGDVPPSHEERLKGKLVVLFCWVLTFAFFTCFAVIIYAWYTKRQDVPETIYVIMSGSFGYIGGVVSVYFGLKQSTQT